MARNGWGGWLHEDPFAPKPALPGTVGRPKRSTWFAALVAALARYTRYWVLEECETIETRIPQTSGDRTEDLSRFDRRFWARSRLLSSSRDARIARQPPGAVMTRRPAALRTPPPNCARQKSGSASARRR